VIFLIDYERKGGCLRLFKSFKVEQRAEAQRERLEIELSLNGSRASREVVLLEAHDEQALHRTHQRYFQTAREILESMANMVARNP
jgi:Ethanolamine utilization protein EutJ (predicted chaperonin)